jgi:hypothetical protein
MPLAVLYSLLVAIGRPRRYLRRPPSLSSHFSSQSRPRPCGTSTTLSVTIYFHPQHLHLSDSAYRKENKWCYPSWPMLPNLFQELRQSGAIAIVVAPIWTCKVWHQAPTKMAPDKLIVAPHPNVFQQGHRALRDTTCSPHWVVIVFRVPSRYGST